jgi:inner membrane protein
MSGTSQIAASTQIKPRPADAVAAIVLIDGAFSSGAMPRFLIAPMDELAHLLTTGLFLDLVRHRVPPSFRPVALAASVLLDLDHLSRAIKPSKVRPRTRPRPHSIATVLAAVLMSFWLPRQHRALAQAVGFGVAAHLARDIARGTAPLAWPITGRGLGVPYVVYAASLYASAWTAQTFIQSRPRGEA